MVYIFYLSRICRNLPCLSASKIPILKVCMALYSGPAGLKKEEAYSQQETPCRTVSKTHFAQPTLVAVVKPIIPAINTKSTSQNLEPAGGSNEKVTKEKEPEWRSMEINTSNLRNYCLMLSKIRLTSLVVITTMGGYALAPGVFDPYTFLAVSLGTGLVSATANSINQFFEVPFDAQMSRTKNRVLVKGHLTPAQAILFATLSGVTGLSILYSEVNGVAAALGAANLVLYTLIYTPMKRISILNTWVGSIVGAIPPLMGWAGCAGNILSPGAWIMSGILYAWQFPHFNALSWNLRPDYSRAGYRMMAVTDPDLCRKTSLRYTAMLTGLCYLAPVLDVTNWWFAVASTPLNFYFLYLAWRFHQESDSANSRKLFRFSLIHLPALMALMLLTKKFFAVEKNHEDAMSDQQSFRQKDSISSLAEVIRPAQTSAL